MKDILINLKTTPNTLKDFNLFIFNKLGKNRQSFSNFTKYPNKLKIPFILEYLETRNVPILDALCYYNTHNNYRALSIEELQYYTIIEEFKRIENGKTINYSPF